MIDPITQTEAVQQRIARIRELVAQCIRFYPVLQHDEFGTHQIAAAATLTGATTIKGMMELRHPKIAYSIGPETIVMSDALIALEFEPNDLERDLIARKAANALATMHDADHVDPAYVKKMLEDMPKHDWHIPAEEE